MKNRKQKEAPPETPQHETATPFFARYLEGQEPEPDAEASVSVRGQRAEFTFSGARKASKKKSASKKSGGKKSGGAKATAKSSKTSKAAKPRAAAVTLKYPSDNDELVFFPYKAEAIELTQGLRATRKFPSDLDEVDAVTLKFPSDNDEVGYFPSYASRAEVPKGATAKPAEGRVKLSRKRPK
jgi:Serine endopeptidase inhibitors